MAASDQSKTEKPTPRKLREAREKGQVAKSPDIATWAGLLLTTVLLQSTVKRADGALRELLAKMGLMIANPTQEGASKYFGEAMLQALALSAPIVLGMMLVNIVATLAQVGLKPSAKRLKPDFSRLNPGKGIKRMFSASSLWELVKSLLKVTVLAFVAWPVASGLAQQLTTGGGSVFPIASATAKAALLVMRNVAAAGLIIAAADFAVQKRRVTKQLMMSRHEVQEEMKQHEGNPQMKGAIRSRQQAMSRNRMIKMVGTADVVIVNPTHYAVALKYDPTRGAPEVVAKGVDHLAAKIRLEATRAGVPIVREPTLARAVYGACDIGQLIPVMLYEAVAQLLAFVFGLRAQGRGDGYHEPRAAFLAEPIDEIDLRDAKREQRRESRRTRRTSLTGSASGPTGR